MRPSNYFVTAGIVFGVTFLAFADMTFWQDRRPMLGWWAFGFLQAGALLWVRRGIAQDRPLVQNAPLAKYTSYAAIIAGIGSLLLLVLLLGESLWGVVGIIALIAAAILVLLGIRQSRAWLRSWAKEVVVRFSLSDGRDNLLTFR